MLFKVLDDNLSGGGTGKHSNLIKRFGVYVAIKRATEAPATGDASRDIYIYITARKHIILYCIHYRGGKERDESSFFRAA